jgi:hypothetical protein
MLLELGSMNILRLTDSGIFEGEPNAWACPL